MILTQWGRTHLMVWLRTKLPTSELDGAFNEIIDWIENNDDDVTEPAYDQGWPRVFELACGHKFSTRK